MLLVPGAATRRTGGGLLCSDIEENANGINMGCGAATPAPEAPGSADDQHRIHLTDRDAVAAASPT
ncbi:hypothetical protein HBB16_02075 [Pseudonocardia sp. MCCB 268]|nr:hypothetical protein [Pseudonocardia cytotoxica]